MLTFLTRSATSQSSSYPIVLTRLGKLRPRPNPHLKCVEVPGIEPATSWLLVRHADHLDQRIIIPIIILIIIIISEGNNPLGARALQSGPGHMFIYQKTQTNDHAATVRKFMANATMFRLLFVLQTVLHIKIQY